MNLGSKYACSTASETTEWIKAIVDFLNPYKVFFEANVVNFVKDRLWESVDKDWIECLKHEPVQHLLQIPSGIVQDHWPASLKEFVLTAKSLSFPREQADIENVFPGMKIISLNNVLSQGMNPKKKHEVEVLSSLVSCISRKVGAHAVIDVGAGQGYLSLVLAFQYELPVVAIDAASHHGDVTKVRAERIKKHYAAKFRKSGLARDPPNLPTTVTCRVLSSSMLRDLSNYWCQGGGHQKEHVRKNFNSNLSAGCEVTDLQRSCSCEDSDSVSSLVLAGLHACGDLSVTMLRAFTECKEVKAMISIGCCYNLLSEDECMKDDFTCGFPSSKGVNIMRVSLGKNARDLACQSAERWRSLEEDDGIRNFDLHGFRAAFQMVLDRYCPDILLSSPSIGRQGKALRRQQKKSFPKLSNSEGNGTCKTTAEMEYSTTGFGSSSSDRFGTSVDKYFLFEKFSHSGLCHLGIEMLEDMDLHGIWNECQPFVGLIGLYWSLRAALGPLLETLLLLDRLLFLQEQENVEVLMLPIFDPVLSPRNMAIIAQKRFSKA